MFCTSSNRASLLCFRLPCRHVKIPGISSEVYRFPTQPASVPVIGRRFLVAARPRPLDRFAGAIWTAAPGTGPGSKARTEKMLIG